MSSKSVFVANNSDWFMFSTWFWVIARRWITSSTRDSCWFDITSKMLSKLYTVKLGLLKVKAATDLSKNFILKSGGMLYDSFKVCGCKSCWKWNIVNCDSFLKFERSRFWSKKLVLLYWMCSILIKFLIYSRLFLMSMQFSFTNVVTGVAC